jgi:hypothetical protein
VDALVTTHAYADRAEAARVPVEDLRRALLAAAEAVGQGPAAARPEVAVVLARTYTRAATLPGAPDRRADAFEQRNLPVDLAIKKFEMLTRKPSSPTTTTSLARANTISSGGGGSVSPSGLAANSASATLHRFNSLANNASASVAER